LSWLVNGRDLEQTGQRELAWALLGHVALDDLGETFEHGANFLLAHAALLGEVGEDLTLGVLLFDYCGFLGCSHVFSCLFLSRCMDIGVVCFPELLSPGVSRVSCLGFPPHG